MTENLTTKTPVEIDTRLGQVWMELAKLDSRLSFQYDEIARAEQRGLPTAPHEEKAQEIRDQKAPYLAEEQAIQDEYRTRRWPRYFLVTSSDGHVHKNNWCSMVRYKTQYALLPDFSGSTAAVVVEECGERACTTCFAEAPLSVFQQQSKLPQDVKTREAAAAARAERERKANEKAAKAIVINEKLHMTTPPRTLVSAQRELSSEIKDAHRLDAMIARALTDGDDEHNTPSWRAHLGNMRDEHLADARVLARAIGIKTDRLPEDVFAESAPKAAKNFTKDWNASVKRYGQGEPLEVPATYTY